MNYDGLAFVVDCSKRIFKSTNGFCDVVPPVGVPNPKTYQNETIIQYDKIIPMQHTYTGECFVVKDKITPIGIMAKVSSDIEQITKHSPVSIDVVNSGNKFAKHFINYESIAKVSLIDRANIISTKFAVNIIDKKQEVSVIKFPYVSVDVNDKAQIVIPSTGESGGFTIVLQKNNFTEIQFIKTPTVITGLPEGMEWNGYVIKGTVTKSGDYTVIVKYPEGQQVLNIIVPYYQRLL